MRGYENKQQQMFSYINLEERVPHLVKIGIDFLKVK
jgi:hypothetical protein